MLGTTERPDEVPSRSFRAHGRRVVVASAALAIALGLTACGSTDSSDAKATPTTSDSATTTATASSTGAAAPAEAPTPEALQAVLVKFSDPAVSTEDKTALIVNGEQRKDKIDQMNKALAGYGALTYEVADITTAADTATAQVTITSPHGTVPAMPITWQNSDGSWKLTDQSGCLMLGFAQAPCVPA
ncbi:hypothetical protein [Nocardia callitridis]|uniref:Low molecular weight antigen MTB12-like C-terminal domain-containing protein n=1 Tax=Nocardia callitridis TaxID=648753 RepID=A0ABP9K7F9_9NOCA